MCCDNQIALDTKQAELDLELDLEEMVEEQSGDDGVCDFDKVNKRK